MESYIMRWEPRCGCNFFWVLIRLISEEELTRMLKSYSCEICNSEFIIKKEIKSLSQWWKRLLCLISAAILLIIWLFVFFVKSYLYADKIRCAFCDIYLGMNFSIMICWLFGYFAILEICIRWLNHYWAEWRKSNQDRYTNLTINYRRMSTDAYPDSLIIVFDEYNPIWKKRPIKIVRTIFDLQC